MYLILINYFNLKFIPEIGKMGADGEDVYR